MVGKFVASRLNKERLCAEAEEEIHRRQMKMILRMMNLTAETTKQRVNEFGKNGCTLC
jgi:hypothetical protein